MLNRNSLQMKKDILSALIKNKTLTFAKLEKKINANWKTIRSHCSELELFSCIILKEMNNHKRNNKPYTEICITEQGINILKKLKKIKNNS